MKLCALTLLAALQFTACATEGAFALDLSGAANMGFRDEVAGDGAGGWTDQGGNDFRNMPLGDQTLCGVPFRIIDPAKNGGKSCLVLRGHELKFLPESAKVVVGRKGAALVFLHALGWGDEKPVANYVINYADRKNETIAIRQGKEILGWWGAQESEQVKIAVQSSNLASRNVCVHAWAWANPRPDVAIESIEFKSTGSQGVPIIVAATLLDKVPTLTSARPARKVPPDGFILLEAENFANFNVPPSVEEKGADGKPTGKKIYGGWADPRFGGGKLFQIQPPAGPQLGGEQPQYMKDRALKVTYEFLADKADRYVLWARIGPANVYSPFRVRVDEGEWSQITRKDPFLDMWDMAFWFTLGWVRLGERQLEPGKHVLHIEVPKPETKEQAADKSMDATLDELTGKVEPVPTKGKAPKSEGPGWGVSADCFVVTRVPFHPCGTLQAGEEINRFAWLDAPARDAIHYLGDEKIADDGSRQRFSLNGLWELARDQEPIPSPVQNDEVKLRGPLTELPDLNTLAWMGVNVPHVEERPETVALHRRWYRKRVTLPSDLKGKRLVIGFGEVNYTASVFVNGKLCGTHVGGYVPFTLDMTDAAKLGEVNEIVVGVKGIAYYRKEYRPEVPWGFDVAFWRAMLVPGRTGWDRKQSDGVFGSAWLETQAPVAAHDLFVRSKFAQKQITCSAEIDNRGGAAFSGTLRFSVLYQNRDRKGTAAADAPVAIGETPLQLDAGKNTELSVTGSAEKLTPWWPDNATLYTIRAEVLSAEGKVLDVAEDTFGYREIELRAKSFFINGKRCNFRYVLAGGKESLEESLAQWRAYNCNIMRLPDGGFNGYFAQDQSAMLRWADELGISVRFCSQINGMSIDVATDDERFWKYSTDYFKQFVKAFRNHPSIIVWVAENELDLISNMGNDKPFKKREWEMLKIAHEIDPSRPVMGDGAGDLLGECEICNWHYCEVGPIVDPNDKQTMAQRGKEGVGAVYPDNAFTFARLSPQCESRNWDRKRPLFVGESYFYSGPVKWQCWVGGDEALSGRFAANEASVRFASMLARGYRWQDVAGFNLLVGAGSLPGVSIRNSFAPVAVFSRDYDGNQFAAGSFARRLKIFNDTFDESPIALEWDFTVDGKAVDSGRSERKLAAGLNEEVAIQIKTPPQPVRIVRRVPLPDQPTRSLVVPIQPHLRHEPPELILPVDIDPVRILRRHRQPRGRALRIGQRIRPVRDAGQVRAA
ncbi:MAG TPA: glycoside hydrolase family 2 TIM barrel-domain containing protein, partial [Planctomycetota bacterium]